MFNYLFPLTAPMVDLNNRHERVKVRLNGNNANEILPILNDDTVCGSFFKLKIKYLCELQPYVRFLDTFCFKNIICMKEESNSVR